MRVIMMIVVMGGLVCADVNNSSVELGVIGALGGILEHQSTYITILISVFTLMLTIVLSMMSFFAHSKSQNLISQIEKNKEKVDKLEEKIEDKVSEIDRDTKSNLKELKRDVYIKMKDIKDDIGQEVSQQMIYNSKELVRNVEDYAYDRIEKNIVDINKRVQDKLFAYQKVIFKVNEAKKLEYEDVIHNESLDFDAKLSKVVAIQSRYNEINNQSIPKLFSYNIEETVVPASLKLSEYEELHEIIIEHLETVLKNNRYSFADKARIKEVLQKHYGWSESTTLKLNGVQ